MADKAGFAVALAFKVSLDGVPTAGMWVDQEPRFGAVTFQTDIAVAVARLACLKVAARLYGMTAGPDVCREKAVRVTRLALISGKTGVVRSDIRQVDAAELCPVREELQVGRLKLGMALAAVLLVVAAEAALRVIQAFQWVDLQPVTAVALRNIVMFVILR